MEEGSGGASAALSRSGSVSRLNKPVVATIQSQKNRTAAGTAGSKVSGATHDNVIKSNAGNEGKDRNIIYNSAAAMPNRKALFVSTNATDDAFADGLSVGSMPVSGTPRPSILVDTSEHPNSRSLAKKQPLVCSTVGRVKLGNLKLEALPSCAWQEYSRGHGSQRYSFFVLKSFVSMPGMKVHTPLTADTVRVRVLGALRIRIQYNRDVDDVSTRSNSNLKPTTTPSSHSSSMKNDPYSHSEETILERDGAHSTDSSHGAEIQEFTLSAPWPCTSIDLFVLERFSHFVCFLGADCDCDDVRSSEDSTPIGRDPVNIASKFRI